MNLKIILTATRPDTSVPFWYETDTHACKCNKFYSDEMCKTLGIQQSEILSDDGLTFQKIYTNCTVEKWAEFIGIMFTLPDVIPERNSYFINNNHTLQLTKINTKTNKIITDISALPK